MLGPGPAWTCDGVASNALPCEAWTRQEPGAGFVTSLHLGPDGRLLLAAGTDRTVAYRAEDGTTAWSAPHAPCWEYVPTAAALAGDAVIDTLCPPGAMAVRSLDIATGEVRWQTTLQTTEETGGTGYVLAPCADATIGLAFAATPGGFHAFELASGRVAWSRTDGGVVGCLAEAGILIARGYHGIEGATTMRLDPATGATLWMQPDGGPAVLAAGALLQAGTTRTFPQQTWARALDPADGHVLWRVVVSSHAARDVAAAPDGSALYVATQSDSRTPQLEALAVRGADGALLWRYAYEQGWRSWDGAQALAVSPDGARVYLAGFATQWPAPDGLLYVEQHHTEAILVALDASRGSQAWVAKFDGLPVPLNARVRDPLDSARTLHSNTNGWGALAVSPDSGRIYAAGLADSALDPKGASMTTVAYEATGPAFRPRAP